MLRPVTIVRCVYSACFTCAADLIGRDTKVETVFELVSRPPGCALSLREEFWLLAFFYFQIFGYLAVAAASLLIVLRVYVRFPDPIIFSGIRHSRESLGSLYGTRRGSS